MLIKVIKLIRIFLVELKRNRHKIKRCFSSGFNSELFAVRKPSFKSPLSKCVLPWFSVSLSVSEGAGANYVHGACLRIS